MWQFLWNSVPSMLPLFVIALFYSEVALYLAARHFALAVLWATVAIGAFVVALDWTSGPSFARENRPFLYVGVLLWDAAVPVVFLSIVALLRGKVRNFPWRHVLILGGSTATVFFWPVFALYSVCATGLDCI